MNEWIKWCKCNRRILTTKQIEQKQDCPLCQFEHAKTLKERLEAVEDEREYNGV